MWITFSAPELARLGLTEKEARKQHGDSIKIYRTSHNTIDRPVIYGNDYGLAKIICNKKGKIIGAHILGSHAGELIHELQLGKHYNIRFSKFNNVIHAYPTYSDVIKKAGRICYIDELTKSYWIRIIKKIRELFYGK